MIDQSRHNRLERKYFPLAPRSSPGGQFYLWPDDAIAMILECKEKGYQVYGLSGIWLHADGAVQPDTGHEWDLSRTYRDQKREVEENGERSNFPSEREFYTRPEAYQEAIQFIQVRKNLKNLSFIVYCEE